MMRRPSRFTVLWTAWMIGGSIAITALVYAISGSAGWAIIAFLGSGIVLNAIGQMVTQPIKAASAGRHQRRGRPGRPIPH